MIRVRVLMTMTIVLFASGAALADTVFTYQGRLLNAGEPANGMFDFEFELWDAANGDDPIGVPQVLNNRPVTNDLFTVPLDFGAEAFDNSDRWLKVTVNGIALTPRQPITRAPYSIQTPRYLCERRRQRRHRDQHSCLAARGGNDKQQPCDFRAVHTTAVGAATTPTAWTTAS